MQKRFAINLGEFLFNQGKTLDDFKNIAENIIATIICGLAVWLWRKGKRDFPPQNPPQQPPSNLSQGSSDAQFIRAQNRARLAETMKGLIFYVLTFWLLYWSIVSPAIFKGIGSKTPLLLSQARFVGELLPDMPIDGSVFQGAFLIAAMILYLPVLWIAQWLASGPIAILRHYIEMNRGNRMRVTLLFFMLLCLPIAAASIFLFYEITYQDAMSRVLGVLAIVGVFIGASSERR